MVIAAEKTAPTTSTEAHHIGNVFYPTTRKLDFDEIMEGRPDITVHLKLGAKMIGLLVREYVLPSARNIMNSATRRIAEFPNTVPHGQELQPSIRR